MSYHPVLCDSTGYYNQYLQKKFFKFLNYLQAQVQEGYFVRTWTHLKYFNIKNQSLLLFKQKGTFTNQLGQ